MFRFFFACALAVATAGAAATPPDAHDPAPLPWRSALDGYRPFADQAVAPWRESNDTVGRIGGWRAYAREASGMPPGPDAAASAAGPAAAPSPAAAAPSAPATSPPGAAPAPPGARPPGHQRHHH